MCRHDGKVAIVTGEDGGIGAAVCDVFARESQVRRPRCSTSTRRSRTKLLSTCVDSAREAPSYRADDTLSAEVDEEFARVQADLGGAYVRDPDGIIIELFQPRSEER
jgi:NAD(P)-dependent dehydrogenase (short-subunit alcohol dehydrogenase family)